MRTLSATAVRIIGRLVPPFTPGAGAIPGIGDTFLSSADTPGSLTATADTALSLAATAAILMGGLYPAVDTYPGSDVYPGRGTDLGAQAEDVNSLIATGA